jgi:hypothetical protein
MPARLTLEQRREEKSRVEKRTTRRRKRVSGQDKEQSTVL